MQKIAVVLACLACAAHGRRVLTSPIEGTADPLQALAGLLASTERADVAFNPSGFAARLPSGQGRISQRARGFRMSDAEEAEPEGEAEAEGESDVSEVLQQKSITDDLLDGLFGDNSPFQKPGEEEESDEDEWTQEDQEELEAQLMDDMAPLRWQKAGNFEEEYLKELALQREVFKEFTEEMEAQKAEEEEDADAPKVTIIDTNKGMKEENLTMISNAQLKLELAGIRKKYALHKYDTGSVQSQVATLTKKIAHLTEHMSRNKKDLSSLRGLNTLVQRRRKHLMYLLKKDRSEFDRITSALGIRTQKFLLPELAGARRIQALRRELGTLAPKKTAKEMVAKKKEKAKMAAMKAKKNARQR